jgi:HlyD family secretion protein
MGCNLGRSLLTFCLAGVVLGSIAWAQPASAPASPASRPAAAAPAGPATCKAAKAAFRVEVRLSGVFEAVKSAEIVLSPEVWALPRVKRAVEHGTAVHKGDVLLWIDQRKLDKAIRDKEAAVQLGELTLKQAEEELRRLEIATPDLLAQAQRGWQRVVDDFDRFTKVDRPLAEKEAASALKTKADVLEYTREELRQLERMYKADDLVEATEEIVLRRQRDAVGRAEIALERAKNDHEVKMKIELPRQAEEAALARQRKDEELKGAQLLLPLALTRKRLEVAKAKADQAQAVKELADLRDDQAALSPKAPMDGIVYYGQCVGGKWPAAALAGAKLAPGAALPVDQVVMTVVDPAALIVRAAVSEKDLHLLAKGMSGQATPAGFPDRKLKVDLADLSAVPVAPGEFDAKLPVAGAPGPVVPGMACAVVLTAYDKPGAIVLPAAAVFGEAGAGGKEGERWVFLKTPGRPQKRVVQAGRTYDGKTEILQGLAEGEEVFTEAPK